MAFYGQQPGYGAPQLDPTVVAWFHSVDADRSGHISAGELQQALTNNDWSRFKLETCYQMISMFDRNYSGTIDIHEFSSLWGFINQWRQVFMAYDQDRSGYISENELHTAFTRMGFNVTSQFTRTAMWKYDVYNRQQLTFEDFINCSVLIQSLTGQFKQRDAQMRGNAQISYDDFMCVAVNNIKP
uniref:Peflin-like n=1 Tax=Ciona intestinalis TaxID=7719 RepID=F6ZB26_CIOIN|nr:peflin-like [Ciona intestinalis]|eukprot:XP_002130586.1 peflin-like [Ciona intestinalis]